MRKIFLSLILLASGFMANAQVSITSLASPYTQNFDSLSNDTTFATTHTMGLNGWSIFERGGGTAVDQMYKVNNGSRNNGETYSYGDSTSADRALGSLASASNLPSYGVIFQNNTGGPINTITVSYKGEEWRSGDTTASSLDSLLFEYSTTATGIDDTAATWNVVSNLSFTTPNLTTTTVGPLSGNAPGNFANISGSIAVLVANNTKIAFRWRDINKVASDDGLAIDDLSVTFSASGNPKPIITATTPADNSTNVNPTLTNLTMTFDQAVVVGSGNITIKNLSDVTQQTISCSATTIAGNTITIPGVTLAAGKQYAVNFDSTCYQTSAGAKAYGIYDNITWNFETQPNGLFNLEANQIEMAMLGEHVLSFTAAESGTYTLSTFSLNGALLSQKVVNATAGKNTIYLDQSKLSKGLYLLRLQNKTFSGRLKIEIQ